MKKLIKRNFVIFLYLILLSADAKSSGVSEFFHLDPITYTKDLFDRMYFFMKNELKKDAIDHNNPLFDKNFFFPRMNIYEKGDVYTIIIEMPGLDSKDINLTLENQNLIIQGEINGGNNTKGRRYYRTELLRGKFKRSIHLPYKVSESDINAQIKNGLLTIDILISKKDIIKGQKIQIKKEE